MEIKLNKAIEIMDYITQFYPELEVYFDNGKLILSEKIITFGEKESSKGGKNGRI